MICSKCGKDFNSKGIVIHERHCRGKRYCICGKQLNNNENKYCSRKCSASVNNKGRTHTINTRKKISITLGGTGEISENLKYCLSCGSLIKNNKFCNNKCQQDFEYKKSINEWLSGKDNAVRSNGGTAACIKKWLINTYGEKCSICNWSEKHPITKNIPVELDHINGDWTNNNPDNIRLLCPNCHSLTPFYRSLNTGNGRKLKGSVAQSGSAPAS